MNILILFIGENKKFDENKILSILQDIPGIQNLREGNFVGSILECEFSEEDDFTLIRLSDDLETISISGIGDASLKIALEIQKRYPRAIRVVDSNYNFELVIEEMESVNEFRQRILEASSAQLPLRSP